MKIRFFVVALYSACVHLLFASALWPIPRNLERGTSFLKLSADFKIQIDLPLITSNAPLPQDLLDAVERTKARMRDDQLQRLVPGRGIADRKVLEMDPNTKSLELLTLAINDHHTDIEAGSLLASIASEVGKDISARSEGYSLVVPADGSPAHIKANSSLGLLRGLTTFEQLWYWTPPQAEQNDVGLVYAFDTPVTIKDDRPAFPYRGFMLDTARNFFPIADIKRTLDAMSMVKMSVFHWHIVDSQSFPLEVPGFPELSQQGAYSARETYSTVDVKDIVTYAAERGIDVLMEVDIPGHTAVIANSHPEHIACPHASPWNKYANEPPAGQLRLASSSTLDFTASLLQAITGILPEDGASMFSTGGDEINTNCYEEDAETQASLSESGKSLEDALDTFTGRMHDVVRQSGRKVVVWEEMALEHKVTLGHDTVVMVWISAKNAAKVAKKGLHVVHAPSEYFYLDCGGGEWIGNSAGTNSWCDPFKSWQKAYTFDPLAKLSPKEASLILGGQQLLWAEQASPQNLDPIVWPRAAVSAEIFWTGARLPSGEFRSVKEALPRLHDLRFRMVQRKINAIPLQPEWCALRPGECDGGAISSRIWSELSIQWAWRRVKGWYEGITLLWETMNRDRTGFTEL